MRKVLPRLAGVLALAGCVRTRLSRWEPADDLSAAREAASGLVAGYWLQDFTAPYKPAVFLGPVIDHSGEAWSDSLLLATLADALIASGKLRLVLPRLAESAPAESLDLDRIKDLARASDADYLLWGELSGGADLSLRSYRLELRLLDPRGEASFWQFQRLLQKPLRVPLKS